MFKKLLGLLSDAAVYGVSAMLARIVGFVTLPILTRYLTAEDYGVISMLTVLSLFFGPLANLGMTNALFRRFNVDKDPNSRATLFATGLLAVTISTLILALVCVFFARPIAHSLLEDASKANLVVISVVTSALSSIGMVPFVTLRAARRVKAAAGINATKLMISIAISLWLVIVSKLGVWGFLVGGLIGEGVTLAVQLAMTYRDFAVRASWEVWRRMCSYGLPIVPHHLQAAAMELFGMYVVGQMLGLQAAGVYGVANKLASPLAFVVRSIQTSWVPYKFQIHADDPNPAAFFRSSFLYYIAGVAYLWVGVSLWGPDVVRVMTGPEFHSAIGLVWAVALIPVAQGIYFMCSTGLELSENTKVYPLVSFAGLAVVVGLTFALVPSQGPLGAALASSAGSLAMAIVIYVISQRHFRVDYDWETIGRIVAVAIVFVCVAAWMQSSQLYVRLGLATLLSLVFPLVCVGLLLRSREERERMLIFLSRLKNLRATASAMFGTSRST
jgi:O-antigen/teichoic acid export membrane protein